MSLIPRVTFLALSSLIVALITVEAKPKSNNVLKTSGNQATKLQDQRVTPNMWSGTRSNQSGLMGKRFPIKDWHSHFSSLGSKRSPIEVEGMNKERKIFKTTTRTFNEKEFPMSRWNDRVKELQKDAQLVEDAQPLKKAFDEQMYQMLLQDTQAYEEMGVELSLRDLNKYQFRRNRSSGEIPVQAAGEQ